MRRHTSALFLFLMAFLVPPIAGAEVVINEIMYEPPPELGATGSYYDNEWVEIYNNDDFEINLSGWTFSERERNHTLSGSIEPHGFLILSPLPENFTRYYNTTAQVLEVKFRLANGGEELTILDVNKTDAGAVNYTPLGGANGLGKTLERNVSGWFESAVFGGTPGRNNSILPAFSENLTQNETGPSEPNNPLLEDNSTYANDSGGQNGVRIIPRISVIREPTLMQFGDYANLQAAFYSGNFSFSEARIVAYVFSPNWISREPSDAEETIRVAPYMSNASVHLQGVPVNFTVHVILPLFLKCNTDNKFPEGNYSLRIRLYSYDGSWETVAENDTLIFVSGENPACSKESCVKETKCAGNSQASCSCGGTSSSYVPLSTTKKIEKNSTAKETIEPIALSPLFPADVSLEENFTTNITLKYSGDSPTVLEAYSYIHDHEKLLSQGFDGEKWRNTWAANSQSLEIAPNETKELMLFNIPKNTTAPGVYTYKIVVADMNSSKVLKEYTYLVRVKEKLLNETSGTSVSVSINRTEPPENVTERISGQAILQQEKTSVFGRIWKWVRGLWS